MQAAEKFAIRKGVMAAIYLAVLSVIEYFISIGLENPLRVSLLLPFVALKGWIILDSFMHIKAVFGKGGH
jgi:cytochrome c oxidase subunit IV